MVPITLEKQFGVKHGIGMPIVMTRLSEQALACIPPRGAKFTQEEWELSNNIRTRNTLDQQQLADRVLEECDRVREMANEKALLWKSTSDHRCEERIQDIEFNAKELQVQRKEVCLELDALEMYKMRLQDCLASLSQNALNICKQCLILRDGRLGIDLVVDEVEQALQDEIITIIGGQSLLRRALEQLAEQMRRLRAARWSIDKDLNDKMIAADIDKATMKLKHTDLGLSLYEGFTDMDPATISNEEWNAYSAVKIRQAGQEVNSARPIRVYIDTLIHQVIEDLWRAYNRCNKAFNDKIDATKQTLTRLEDLHADIVIKVKKIQDMISLLQRDLVDKQKYAALAHTRLGRRANRPGAELVKDPGNEALKLEAATIRASVEEMQQMMHEATSTLRYLLQTQIQLEEDINVKMNTVKIDEVDCMTLRKGMDYHEY